MENNNFVFDSYALLCFFKKEPGYDKVKALQDSIPYSPIKYNNPAMIK